MFYFLPPYNPDHRHEAASQTTFSWFFIDRLYLDFKILKYEDVQSTLNGCTNAESEKNYAD